MIKKKKEKGKMIHNSTSVKKNYAHILQTVHRTVSAQKRRQLIVIVHYKNITTHETPKSNLLRRI